MAGNPFAFPGQNEQDYSLYTIEILKNLKYLDYEPIDDNKRRDANSKHGEVAKELENLLAEKKEAVEKEIDPELVEAKIDCTEDMLEKILNSDPEAQNIRNLTQFPEDWRAFDEAINENNVKFQTDMKSLHKDKMNTIRYCTKEMRESELKAERDSIELIRKLLSLKKHKLRDIEENPEENNDMMIEESETDLLQQVDVLEDNLMEIEMLLQDALHLSVS